MRILDRRVQFIQKISRYNNAINNFKERYVDHTKILDLDNVVMIVHKHTSKDNNELKVCFYHVTCAVSVNLQSVITLMSRNSLLEKGQYLRTK